MGGGGSKGHKNTEIVLFVPTLLATIVAAGKCIIGEEGNSSPVNGFIPFSLFSTDRFDSFHFRVPLSSSH